MKLFRDCHFGPFFFSLFLLSCFSTPSWAQFTLSPVRLSPLNILPTCNPSGHHAPSRIVAKLCARVDACTTDDSGFNNVGCVFTATANTRIGGRLGLADVSYTGNVIRVQEDIRWEKILV